MVIRRYLEGFRAVRTFAGGVSPAAGITSAGPLGVRIVEVSCCARTSGGKVTSFLDRYAHEEAEGIRLAECLG